MPTWTFSKTLENGSVGILGSVMSETNSRNTRHGNTAAHNQTDDDMTRYIKAFSWPKDIERFLRETVKERPILNVCCGESLFGNVRMDKYEDYSLFAPPDVIGDMEQLPFPNDSFGAVFSDPPWYANYKEKSANFIKDALRVAPVVYLMSPWIYGSSNANLTDCWVRQHPGINNAIVLARYERADI